MTIMAHGPTRAPRSRACRLTHVSPLASQSRIMNKLEVKVQRAAVALERAAQLLDIAVRLGAPVRVRVCPQIVPRLTRELADCAQRQVV